MSTIVIPEAMKALVAKVRSGAQLTAEERAEMQSLADGIGEQHGTKFPDPRDVYVTDAHGELVIDKAGYPIPK